MCGSYHLLYMWCMSGCTGRMGFGGEEFNSLQATPLACVGVGLYVGVGLCVGVGVGVGVGVVVGLCVWMRVWVWVWIACGCGCGCGCGRGGRSFCSPQTEMCAAVRGKGWAG